jgi:uncharacterized phage infection (PIP) family protein YhgE
VRRVTDIMGEISAASEEQSGGIEQVNRAVSQMDDVTQQNAALVEQAAAAAASLEEQTRQLRGVVGGWRVSANGSSDFGSFAAPPPSRTAVRPQSAAPAVQARSVASATKPVIPAYIGTGVGTGAGAEAAETAAPKQDAARHDTAKPAAALRDVPAARREPVLKRPALRAAAAAPAPAVSTTASAGSDADWETF